jgi:L-lactate dehydrogenase complex protein LldG
MKQTPVSDEPAVLVEIRRALGRSESSRPPALEPFIQPGAEGNHQDIVAQFIAEVTAVRGEVHCAQSDEEVAPLIIDICRSTGARKVALSGSPLLAERNLSARFAEHGLEVMIAAQFGPGRRVELLSELAGCGAGVTAVDYAIAETGTIVLSSDEEHALVVSLLPPVHIAVVGERQVKATMAEAVSWLKVERMGRSQSCRSANFITGPSRTSDVELTLSIGVHGPKELHLIVLAE